jgi:hypothetical protein
MRALILIGSLSILTAMPAHAGVQTPSSFSCVATYQPDPVPPHSPIATGYTCSGTLAGARNSANSTDFASFIYNLGNSTGFSASYLGQQYACVSPTSSVQSEWPVAMAARGYFWVHMDFNGNCTMVEFYNSSQYVNY